MLAAYCHRIGLAGPVEPTFEGLAAVMTAHLAAIPFEGLDAFLGRGGARGIAAIHDKLVIRRRGGWCYEQNGLLGWALNEMGFSVIPLAARVNRTEGEAGGHLALIVELAGHRLLVDVGFGGSQTVPLKLVPTAARHEPFAITLTERDGWWRYSEDAGSSPFFYEFELKSADPERLEHWQNWQATSPDSSFVANLVAQRRIGEAHVMLRGRVLTERDAAGERRRVLGDAAELVAVLADRFGLDVPEVADKWPVIVARHSELFGIDDRASG
jgi:N-hydroxyarylamine O-acetyltransferase